MIIWNGRCIVVDHWYKNCYSWRERPARPPLSGKMEDEQRSGLSPGLAPGPPLSDAYSKDLWQVALDAGAELSCGSTAWWAGPTLKYSSWGDSGQTLRTVPHQSERLFFNTRFYLLSCRCLWTTTVRMLRWGPSLSNHVICSPRSNSHMFQQCFYTERQTKQHKRRQQSFTFDII